MLALGTKKGRNSFDCKQSENDIKKPRLCFSGARTQPWGLHEANAHDPAKHAQFNHIEHFVGRIQVTK